MWCWWYRDYGDGSGVVIVVLVVSRLWKWSGGGGGEVEVLFKLVVIDNYGRCFRREAKMMPN